jgi:CheY-like chemotaxis protein
MRILIIDDDRFLTTSIQSALHSRGYSLTVLNKARELTENPDVIHQHDLVLLDLMMRKPPGLVINPGEETGEALFRLIRQTHKDIPVIIMTGKENEEVETTFSKLGITVLLKPLDACFEDLYEAIRHAC